MDGAFPSEKGQDFDSLSSGGYGRGAGAGRRGFRGTAENAKTKLCTRWQAGDCRFGDRCNFAHGDDELRKLPPREENGGRFAGGRGGGRGPPPSYGYNNGRGSGPGSFRGAANRPGGYEETYGQYPQGGYGGAPGGYAAPSPAGGNYNAGAPGNPGTGPAGYGPVGGVQDQGQPARVGGEGGQEAWAANGYPLQGPNGWVMYKVKETGEPYYHNHRTNATQWERPPEWPAS